MITFIGKCILQRWRKLARFGLEIPQGILEQLRRIGITRFGNCILRCVGEFPIELADVCERGLCGLRIARFSGLD